MADRGRDLKIGLISDLDRFDVEPAADALDQVADSAKDAGKATDQAADELRRLALQGDDARRELERMNREAAGNDFDRLGTDATATARKVRGAFDDIAAAAKTSAKKTDDAFDTAGQGLDDFKTEAGQSGREAAASFSGSFDDVAGLIQETAANAFGGFGPAGAAAGVAAAAGVGFVVTAIQEAKERLKELVQLFDGLGRDGASQKDRIRGVLDELDPDRLTDIREALDRTGLDAERFFEALASGDPGKAAAVRRELEAMVPTFNLPWDGKANEARHLIEVLGDYSDAAGSSQENTALYNEVLGQTAAQADAAAAAVDATAAAHDAYRSAVEGSLEQVNASWTDSVDELKGTLADYQKALDEQTTAVRRHKDNLLEVQKTGDEEFVEWVAGQPAQVAAAYAKGTAAQRASFYQSWKENVGAAAAEGVTAGLDAGAPGVAGAAGRVHAAAQRALSKRLEIATQVVGPTAAEIAAQRDAVQAWLDAHPNVVRIRAEIDSNRNP